MYCRNCGAELPDEETVTCPDCGMSVQDPYKHDILPEVNDELCQIPKDIVVKMIGIILAVLGAVIWLLFFA